MSNKRSVARLVQALKTALVKRGSGSLLTRAFLVSYAVSRGFRIQLGDAVSIRKGASILRIPTASLYMVPYMMKYFDAYFNSLDAIEESGIRVLDFSKPNFHRYTSTGTGFYFPSTLRRGASPERRTGCCFGL